jgi:drug/metabolite transporter (DMT)-like permease
VSLNKVGNPLAPALGLVLAMFIWGSSFIVMKIALTACHPLLVIFGRLLVAAVIVFLLRHHFGEIRYRRGDWKPLLFMALCEPCLYFGLEGYALHFTSASEAGMITALLPLMSAVTARCALGEKISRQVAVWLSVALLGAVGLTFGGKPAPASPSPMVGNTLELLAMVFAAAYSTTSRYLSDRYSPLFLTAVQAFVGTVFFAPALLLPSVDIPAGIGWLPGLSIVYLGAAVSIAAYFLYNYGLSRLPVSRVSPYLNLIPLCSVLLGWLILDEHLTVLQYISAFLVLGGTLLSQVAPEESEKAETEKWPTGSFELRA